VEFPVQDFDDCYCALGFTSEYSDEQGTFSCVESDEEKYLCPNNSYIKPGIFPPQTFSDCGCDFAYVRNDDGSGCIDRNSMTSPVSMYECPVQAYISSDRWPIEDFSDCSCSWGHVRSEGQCVLPPDASPTATEEKFTVAFTEDVTCGQVLSEAQALVAAVGDALPSASAVFISGSSCENPSDKVEGRRLDQAANYVTIVAVEEESTATEPSTDLVASALVDSGFQLSNVELEEETSSNDSGSELIIGVSVGAVCIGLAALAIGLVVHRRRQQPEDKQQLTAGKGRSDSQLEMKNPGRPLRAGSQQTPEV
jgi:hypothetical protein